MFFCKLRFLPTVIAIWKHSDDSDFCRPKKQIENIQTILPDVPVSGLPIGPGPGLWDPGTGLMGARPGRRRAGCLDI